jgi:DNA-binding transcriptional ArsR family regulator
MNGAGDRELKRIEELLLRLLERIERLENLIASVNPDPLTSIALELTMVYAKPAALAVKAATEVLNLERGLGGMDPISRAIVEALVAKDKPLSLSELTREVRALRGTASRRIITERVKKLEERGVVEVEKVAKKTVVRLRKNG